MPTSSTTNQIYIPGLTDQINDGIANITPQQMVEERFYDSGTWTKPSGVNTVEVIVVGGGGGGGGSRYGAVGGGGGAGEYRRGTFSVSSGVSITVGNGGAGGLYDRQPGNPGNQSSFGTFLTADGGGGGMTNWYTNPIRTYGSTGGGTYDGVNNYNMQAGGGGGAGSPGKSGDHGPHPRFLSWNAYTTYKRRGSNVNTGGFGAYNDNSASYSPTYEAGNGGDGIDGIAGGGAGGGQTYSYDSNSYTGYRVGHSGGGDSGFARLRGKAWNLTNNSYFDLGDGLWMHDGLPAIPGTGSGGGGANMLPQGSNYHMTRSEWADVMSNPWQMQFGNTDYRGWRSITDLVAALPGETGYSTGTTVTYNGENWSWQSGSQRATASTSGKAVLQGNSLMPYVFGLHFVPSVGTFGSYQPGGSTTTQFGWAIYNRDRQLLGYTLKSTQYSTGTGWTSTYAYNTNTNDYNTYGVTNNFYHPDAFFMAPIVYVNNLIAGSYYGFDTSDSARFYNSGRGGDGGKGIVIVRYAVK